jgi:uncharacterized membrane protein
MTSGIKHRQKLLINFFFAPEKTGEKLKLEFLLYKEENFTARYRDLHLWVNVT